MRPRRVVGRLTRRPAGGDRIARRGHAAEASTPAAEASGYAARAGRRRRRPAAFAVRWVIEDGKVFWLNMSAETSPALARAVGVPFKQPWLQTLGRLTAKMMGEWAARTAPHW